MDSIGDNKKTIGKKGEEIAAEYMVRNGYILLETNFRFRRMGEIDIIAKEKEYICFVEVKTRSSILFGTPSEAVNKHKIERIKRLAMVYLSINNLKGQNIRFDVVEVFLTKKRGVLELIDINIIKNAF